MMPRWRNNWGGCSSAERRAPAVNETLITAILFTTSPPNFSAYYFHLSAVDAKDSGLQPLLSPLNRLATI